MKENITPRALFVLAITPLLTLIVSLSALVGVTLCRCTAKQVQCLPRWWGRIIVRASGARVRIEGVEHVDPAVTCIFAANHLSQFDIFALQGYLPFDFRWLAKKELFKVPIFGTAMRKAGYIPVDRAHGRQALLSLDEAARRIAEGTAVIIFPEGTRSPDGFLHPFKSGAMVLAIKAGVPVVPVAIAGTYEILPKGSLFVRKGGEIVIRFGKPIKTSDFTVRQKNDLALLLHDQVAAMLPPAMVPAGEA